MWPALVMLARGATLRCPRCGGGGLFGRRWALRPRCPRCDLRLEREEGALLGSMALNIGATTAGFIALFGFTAVLTWPSVPWLGLTVAGVAFCTLFPVAFYPFSKTLWAATDLVLHASSAEAPHRAGRRVTAVRDLRAVAVSPEGASRPVTVPVGTALVIARDRREDVPRITCVPADPGALGLEDGEYVVVRVSDLEM